MCNETAVLIQFITYYNFIFKNLIIKSYKHFFEKVEKMIILLQNFSVLWYTWKFGLLYHIFIVNIDEQFEFITFLVAEGFFFITATDNILISW